jgi:hypothetical protein
MLSSLVAAGLGASPSDRSTHEPMNAVIVEIDGKRYHLREPEVMAHVRYLAEHEAVLADRFRGSKYYELILFRTVVGNGAEVLAQLDDSPGGGSMVKHRSLPFTKYTRTATRPP